MKIHKLLRFSLVLSTGAALLLAGCSTPSKHIGGGSDPGELADLPNGGTDALGGIPIGPRPTGKDGKDIDPNKDVNYSILAAQTIYFAYDSITIAAGERGKLQAIADWLKDNEGKRLMLGGHADVRGTPEYNRGLGERRAEATREYLVGLGVDKSRLFTISYGSDRPAVDEKTDEAYAKNRRVAPGVITK